MPRPRKHARRGLTISPKQPTRAYHCPIDPCPRLLRNQSGWTQHMRSAHPNHEIAINFAEYRQIQDMELTPSASSSTSESNISYPTSPSIGTSTREPSLTCYSNTPQEDVDILNELSFIVQLPESVSSRSSTASSTHSQSDSESSKASTFTPEHMIERHPFLTAQPCNKEGYPLEEPLPPPDPEPLEPSWYPFENENAFKTAEYFYAKGLSAKKIDTILNLFAEQLRNHGDSPPFNNHQHMYDMIDAIPHGDINWKSIVFNYEGPEVQDPNPPKWMTADYTVWYRDPRQLFLNMLKNPDFASSFDYSPFREFDNDGCRQYKNLMSGDWAWDQAELLSEDPNAEGSMFVPIILGSDKTTVSVATGQNDYWPLYGSIGNIFNSTRRAHSAGLVLIGFLAIAKADNVQSTDPKFRQFRRRLFHKSLSKILAALQEGMTIPELARCPDGYYRRIIWGLGPYIGDYPEQVLLSCIVQGWCARCRAHRNALDDPNSNHQARQKELTAALIAIYQIPELWSEHGIIYDTVPFTNDFPRADIHELIAPDLLHQVIKGAFKDHLVEWVSEYLNLKHGKRRAKKILDEIDHRISLVPPFTGLRRFPEGRGFKQWTGDDSKALMKVYLPVLEGFLPTKMIQAFRAFLEFCYIARQEALSDEDLIQLKDALTRFHRYREIFVETGVRMNISLPRQHALSHYAELIRLFGAPNGLCSSITESKHIRAVKEPWRHTNRNEPLAQILLINQRLDKLSAARSFFTKFRMLHESLEAIIEDKSTTESTRAATQLNTGIQTYQTEEEISEDLLDEFELGPDDNHSSTEVEVKLAKKPRHRWTLEATAVKLEVPGLSLMIRQFLYDQVYPNSLIPSSQLSSHAYPDFKGRISLYYTAAVRFHSPSESFNRSGKYLEYIRATPMWKKTPRYDTVLINSNPDIPGMQGFEVARTLAFLSFSHEEKLYQCALVHWFNRVEMEPDVNTGLWIVQPEFEGDHEPYLGLIAIDSIYCAAHLIPVFRTLDFLDHSLTWSDTLDTFEEFYVNRFIDYHAFRTIF